MRAGNIMVLDNVDGRRIDITADEIKDEESRLSVLEGVLKDWTEIDATWS